MKKIGVVTLILFSFTFSLHSQNYHSDLEKEVFETYINDSINYPFIKSMCAIDANVDEDNISNYLNNIQAIIDKIPPKELKEKKEKKRVKLIYDTFHKRFFRKYVADSYFTDIFKTGNYNCVTATAMYAYVFDQLNIPYHVKEAPSHVYLIAYPYSYKILLETTVPSQYGFIVPKDSEIKKIVDELVSMKLVTKSELNSQGYDEIYIEYFYGKEFVDKSSLIGMQYYNKTFIDFENEDYKSAQDNITKSLVFHSNPLSEIISFELLKVNIEELDFNTDTNIDLLIDYFSQLKFKDDFTSMDVKHFLYKIVESDDNDNSFIESAAIKLSKFDDEELNNLCVEFIYEYLARNEMDKLNYDNAIKYSANILEVNPKSKVSKEIIAFAVSKKVNNSEPNEELIVLIEGFYSKYPFLASNKRIETSRVRLFGYIIVEKFSQNEPDKALEYLDKFNEIVDSKKEFIVVDSRFYPKIYLLSGRYFYGRSDFKQAKEIFSKGLEIVPENDELQRMLKWSIEDMN